MNTSSHTKINNCTRRSSKPIYLLVFVLLLFVGCQSEQESGYFTQSANSVSDIQFESLELDSFYLEDVQSSLGGVLVMDGDKLNFVDYQFGRVYQFDTDGNFIELVIERGRGPSELPRGGITFYNQLPDGGHLFVGSSYDYYVFNADYERLQDSMIRFQQDKPVEYLHNNPTPEDHRSYNLAYYMGDVRAAGDVAFLPLLGGEPQYTAFSFTTDLFAEEARILASMNLETGEVDRIFGRLSPVYAQNPPARLFSFFFYDMTDDETLAISYAADPNIYLFSTDFEHLVTFGSDGRDMDMDFEDYSNVSERDFEDFLVRQWRSKDVFSSVTFIPETNLLFRGYTRRADPDMDGLQIYRDNVLIADVDIPNMLKVIGYHDGWYYTDAEINEREETKKVYRFRLDVDEYAGQITN